MTQAVTAVNSTHDATLPVGNTIARPLTWITWEEAVAGEGILDKVGSLMVWVMLEVTTLL
jgi:hypothetical protein